MLSKESFSFADCKHFFQLVTTEWMYTLQYNRKHKKMLRFFIADLVWMMSYWHQLTRWWCHKIWSVQICFHVIRFYTALSSRCHIILLNITNINILSWLCTQPHSRKEAWNFQNMGTVNHIIIRKWLLLCLDTHHTSCVIRRHLKEKVKVLKTYLHMLNTCIGG